MSELKANFDKLEPGTAKWEKAAVEIERENAKLAGMEQQLKGVEVAFQRVHAENSKWGKTSSVLSSWGDSIQNAGGKLRAFGDNISGIGSTFTKGVTAPIVAGAGVAVKAAIDFESAFAGVKKTVDETATISYKNLSDSIRQMSKELPVSAVEIANVAEAAGQLGIKTEDVMSFSRTMIDMGESTNLSATDAATAIAKIANITGLTADEYSRFGSSVVALGNNFATTESDIVNMANRLASAGTLAGLTNQEILGLATAMSSVGIEAEAGGTAMTQTLSEIEKVVVEAGEDLVKFADIAGMSAEQFSTTWKEKPIEAVQAFIKGLGELDKEGESATLVLDELGLSGVRQSNMLKSLALASDTLTGAVDLSTKAWNENNALTNEASKRYETTESKLKMLKNEVVDVAIEFGGPLVDALRDGLRAGKPLIEMLANMAKNFSSLDKEQQQQIIKWGLIAAAAGPTLSIFGKGIGIISNVVSGLGTTSKWLGTVTGKIANVRAVAQLASGASGLGGLGTAAGIAESGVAGLSSATGLLSAAMSPAGLLILGTTALAGGLAYLGHQKDVARQKLEEFGTQLDGTARGELREFKSKVDDTKNAVAEFTTHAGDVERVGAAFKQLYDDVAEGANKANGRLSELASKWGLSDEQIARAREKNNQIVANTETMMNQINEIYQRHNGEAGKFSQEEKEIILNNQNEMIKAKLELMDLSAEQQKSVLRALNGEIAQLNETQLQDTRKSLEKALKEENSAYKTSRAELKELLEEKWITNSEYNQKLEQLESQHNTTMEGLSSKYYQAMRNLDSKLKDRTGQSWNYWEEAKKLLEEYGVSYDDIGKKAAEAAKNAGHSHSILAKYSQDMTKETKEANDAWSALIGNINENGNLVVKSNAKEVIGEATKSAEGWERFKFIAKHADIDTNTRVVMTEALVESGKWQNMTLDEKELVVNNQAGLQAIFDSENQLKIWNSMPETVKQLLLDNKDVMSKAEVAKATLDNYNNLTPNQKKLLADDENIRTAVSRSTDILKTWNAATPFAKDLKVNATEALLNSQLSINKVVEWNKSQPDNKFLQVDSTGAIINTENAKNALTQYNGTSTLDKILNVDSTNAVTNTSQATSTVNTYNETSTPQKDLIVNPTNAISSTTQAKSTVDLFNNTLTPTKLLDANASSLFGSTNQSIATLGQFNATTVPTKQLNAQDNASGVAQGVIGWLNSIPRSVTTVIETVKKFVGLEKGTNYHEGGPAIVNDQKGYNYKELIRLPSGETFIPQGRNVLLDLPRGTKVFPARKTQQLMRDMGIPKYAQGVGIPNDSRFIQEMTQAQARTVVVASQNNGASSAILAILKEILVTLTEKDNEVFKEVCMNVKIGNRTFSEIVEMITLVQEKQAKIQRKTSSV
ncbi:phage tail tape measure protein [Streptococcus sp. B01]|uniref:phage tail tape measure protein n=1 Tax=Streptococcus sp. B01 TaxID=2928734 RepID=UPI00211B39D3|nr:phage tail tape measure protein [Streptococcus sp. B01]MCQ9211814.1 phage tail tape measure protein [Streptococcus sp. B01]